MGEEEFNVSILFRIFDLITEDPGLSGETTVVLLHSQMPSSEHKKSFKPPARGCRKVVLATNVAETGITIQDIVYVIDSGKVVYSCVPIDIMTIVMIGEDEVLRCPDQHHNIKVRVDLPDLGYAA